MRIDDDIAKQLVKLRIWKYTSPNFITISGMISNYLILHSYLNHKKKLGNALLIWRFCADILDGEIASKYNKTSKIGGLLDTTSDNLLTGIIIYLLLNKFYKNKIRNILICVTICLLYLLYLIKEDSLYFHNSIKNNDSNIIQKIAKWNTNNIIFVYAKCFIFLNRWY